MEASGDWQSLGSKNGGYGFRVHRFLGTAPPDVQDSGVRDRVSW